MAASVHVRVWIGAAAVIAVLIVAATARAAGASTAMAILLAAMAGASVLAGVALAKLLPPGDGAATPFTRLMGEAQMRALLDHAPARITLKDTQGRFVLVNRSTEEWFGVQAKDVLGRAAIDVYPAGLGRVYDEVDRLVIETGRPQQTQAEHRRPEGVAYSSVLKFPIRGDDGTITGVGTIGTDVTARHRAEQALLDAKEAAERASHLKSAFLAAMSHELRTPLNAIIGFSELMEMEPFGPLGDERYRAYIRSVGDGGRHLLGIVNDILDLARIEAGREAIVEEEVELDALLEGVMRTMQVHADRGRVDLRLRMMRKPPPFRCEPRRLRQIVFNLVSNAVKFTPAGGAVTVTARTMPDLEIEVSDTGIGIPEHRISELFEPFSRIVNHMTRDTEGAGLGLPLTQRFVELHGGTISLASAPGAGTTVTVRLPASRFVGDAPA
ncbi:MAG: ATP-binding protein [Alphaproteobacteria bacterium]